MAAILVYPGQRSEPVALDAILREAHEAAREARAKEIAARKEANVPLDDETRWSDVSAAVHDLQAAMLARKTAEVTAAASKIVTLTDGHELAPIDEWVPNPDHHGIMLTLEIVSDAARRNWRARELAGWQRMVAAGDDPLKRRDADEEIMAVRADLVATVCVGLSGLEGLKGTVRESLDALRLSGLLGPLYVACRYFLDLPAGKALRCGRLLPST